MISQGVDQLCWVTGDIDQACATFADRYGMRAFLRSVVEFPVTVGGRSGMAELEVAFANAGDLQIEIVQPLSGLVEIYADALALAPGSAMVFHHFAMLTRGTHADWLDTRARLAATGRTVALEADLGELAVAYLDEREALGHYIEHIWISDAELARRETVIPRYPATWMLGSVGAELHPLNDTGSFWRVK